MGITSFSPQFSRMPVVSVFMAPVQALVALFSHSHSSSLAIRSSAVRVANHRFASQCIPKNANLSCPPRVAVEAPIQAAQAATRAASRLKIVREFEPGIPRSSAGRMVISGRMADVCAELDRMAQSESAPRQTSMF